MPTDFKLIMISAMYENGGNTTQRFLDGHPELFSYPFESQPGSKYVLDHLTSMFPVKYRGGIFIARHGSWDRSEKIGGDIIHVTLNRDGSVKSWEPFLTGFLKDNAYIGRPVDLAVMKDGSLLVSDDHAGAVYRISYGRASTAAR